MDLNLSENQRLLVDTFERFFRTESTPARVRAAQPLGFDPALWKGLAELGAITMRNNDFSLLDAALVLEEAGRALASAPLAEAVAAARLLGELENPHAQQWAARAGDGQTVVTLALHEAKPKEPQLVPGGTVAHAIVYMSGNDLMLLETTKRNIMPPSNLAGQPIAEIDLLDPAAGTSRVLASGPSARRGYLAAREEWKVLTAAALAGLSRQAIQLAAAYATERIQFGRPIGTYQGISHPLADRITETDGAQLLLRRALSAIAQGEPQAAMLVSMAYWWAARTAGESVAASLHTFGGYGLTMEYDIHLYHLRAKGWPLMLGDPEDELFEAGRRLRDTLDVPLPPVGAANLDFSHGPAARALAEETRRFFEANLTPELRAKAHYSYDGFDAGFHRKLGEAHLLYPGWPVEWGGRGVDTYAASSAKAVWEEFGWSTHAVSTTDMVGQMVIRFGCPELRAEVVPGLVAGDAICSLGYTEPSSGSDVFAARTQAVRDGDDWVINGQKIFTSGANLAAYVLLLTRTDPQAPKHLGITMFLVPLRSQGIEIHPIYTFQDERTNSTFYSNVKVSDRYRLGPVNGGIQVLTAALELEQGGGSYIPFLRELLGAAVNWARNTMRDGKAAIQDPRVLLRLAGVATRTEVADVLCRRSQWATAQKQTKNTFGPMSKVFTTETFLRGATDLLDLTAPGSLMRGKGSLKFIEESHRHASATTIYAGASEVMRSMIAEKALGLPRSRA